MLFALLSIYKFVTCGEAYRFLLSFFLSLFSDGITTQDDGGESTEPEQPERTMYFGQAEETPG